MNSLFMGGLLRDQPGGIIVLRDLCKVRKYITNCNTDITIGSAYDKHKGQWRMILYKGRCPKIMSLLNTTIVHFI